MTLIARRLIELVEGAFVGCVAQNLPDRFPRMCFVPVEHPPPEAPVRFQLIFDMTQFRADPACPRGGALTIRAASSPISLP